PLKPAAERKRRLAGRLDPDARAALGEQLFRHVVAVLGEVSAIGSVAVLSQERPIGWTGGWLEDRGRGLNGELEAARASLRPQRLVVIHADLPLLAAADVTALVAAAAEAGLAIAPDRHGTGTNALAIADGRDFPFRFGRDSFALHRAQAGGPGRVVSRSGLALDIDTPEDLDAAIAAGFQCGVLDGTAGT
ncbi:MAG TPA: 2-phospho-L-lactate guanylyltransferase, partial [Stellaceae bacterium]|nr:2-phospho-L-lactate guanylyltransferase [Stellaceae bacterium]